MAQLHDYCMCGHRKDWHAHYLWGCDGCPCEKYRHAAAEEDDYSFGRGAPRASRPGTGTTCPHPDTVFDRTLCAEPCHTMHTFCRACGLVLDYCAHVPGSGAGSGSGAGVAQEPGGNGAYPDGF